MRAGEEVMEWSPALLSVPEMARAYSVSGDPRPNSKSLSIGQ